MLKLALLDIGSNSIHMILTEILPDLSYKILDRIKDVPRLGEETFQTGQFSPDAIAKGIEVVRTFTTLARNRGFTRVEAVATSAVRDAAKGGPFPSSTWRGSPSRTSWQLKNSCARRRPNAGTRFPVSTRNGPICCCRPRSCSAPSWSGWTSAS